MNALINFRDQGCQGAINIIEKAKSLALNTSNFQKQDYAVTRLLYVVPVDVKERLYIKTNIYKEISDILELDFRIIDIDAKINEDDFVILDSNYLENLEEINKIAKACIVEDSKEDFLSPYAIGTFSTYIYTAIKNNKAFEDISINWIGDSGIKQELFIKSLLNASVCMKNCLAFAFENDEENSKLYMPHSDNLDFAMNAGAKIFLSHDASMLDNEADIVYLSPWSYKDNNNNNHPFTIIQNDYTNKAQIISLISDIKSSSIDEDLYNKVALNTRLAAISYLLTK